MPRAAKPITTAQPPAPAPRFRITSSGLTITDSRDEYDTVTVSHDPDDGDVTISMGYSDLSFGIYFLPALIEALQRVVSGVSA